MVMTSESEPLNNPHYYVVAKVTVTLRSKEQGETWRDVELNHTNFQK